MLQFGIFGAGNIAEKFAHTFQLGLVQGAAVRAVAAREEARAKAFGKKCDVPYCYGSYDALLADSGVDAVYVATINTQHYAQCKAALLAGKHVLCEKPMVLHAAEARELTQLAKEKNLFLMEAVWSRFLPCWQTVQQWVNAGKIGRLQSVSASLCMSRTPQQHPRLFEPALGGGAFYDLGIYPFTLVQFLAGQRKLVQANPVCIPTHTGVDGATFLHMIYEDGFVGEIKCACTLDVRSDAYICGTDGYIRIAPCFQYGQLAELFYQPRQAAGDYVLPQPTESFLYETPSGFEFEINHFAACIAAGKLESDVMPHAHTIESAEIFDKIAAQLQK